MKNGTTANPTLLNVKHGKANATIYGGYVRMRLNDLEIFLLSDGHIALENPQPIFAPEINVSDVKDILRSIYLPENRLESGINVMVIKTNNRIILIDTGRGHHSGESGGWLLHNLEGIGINAVDITDILITHAHADHIGGIISKSGELIYPNANYYIAKTEYNFWMTANPDFSKSKNTRDPMQSVNLAQSVIGFIKEKLILFQPGDVLFSLLTTELAEGHTPGHTIFTVSSGDKSIRHIVDIVHSPLLIVRPEWGTQWDVDFEEAVNSRKRILEECSRNRTLVMTTHLPWPGLGYIGKKEIGYYWIPVSYYVPNEISL